MYTSFWKCQIVLTVLKGTGDLSEKMLANLIITTTTSNMNENLVVFVFSPIHLDTQPSN